MWRKSSRSGGNGGQCVEVRKLSTDVDVRDSKLGDSSPILSVSRSEFASILGALKNLGSPIHTPASRRGLFSFLTLPCLGVSYMPEERGMFDTPRPEVTVCAGCGLWPVSP